MAHSARTRLRCSRRLVHLLGNACHGNTAIRSATGASRCVMAVASPTRRPSRQSSRNACHQASEGCRAATLPRILCATDRGARLPVRAASGRCLRTSTRQNWRSSPSTRCRTCNRMRCSARESISPACTAAGECGRACDETPATARATRPAGDARASSPRSGGSRYVRTNPRTPSSFTFKRKCIRAGIPLRPLRATRGCANRARALACSLTERPVSVSHCVVVFVEPPVALLDVPPVRVPVDRMR